jgi:hypothetical protein
MLNNSAHAVGHENITLSCPISCVGVRTVADLLRLLGEAARAAGAQPPSPSAVDLVPHVHEQITVQCPVRCLELSRHASNPLRLDGRVHTVGDVLRLLEAGELGGVRNLGRRRVQEVRMALIAAGFSVSRYPALKD